MIGVPQTCIEAIGFQILLFCSLVSMPGPPRSNNILPLMHCISIYGSLTGFPSIDVLCPNIVGTGISVNFAMYFIVAISLSMANRRWPATISVFRSGQRPKRLEQ